MDYHDLSISWVRHCFVIWTGTSNVIEVLLVVVVDHCVLLPMIFRDQEMCCRTISWLLFLFFFFFFFRFPSLPSNDRMTI